MTVSGRDGRIEFGSRWACEEEDEEEDDEEAHRAIGLGKSFPSKLDRIDATPLRRDGTPGKSASFSG